MHRTQIMLEPEQVAALRKLSRRSGKSMGQLIREFVDVGIAGKRHEEDGAGSTLESLRGFIAESDVCGREHDRVLYGDD
jgi:hypothetical protein